MAEPKRVILDTDVGDDVDDAFAIAQAVLHPGIELEAVTTCYGDTNFRAELAKLVVEASGSMDVPIFSGPSVSFSDGTEVSTQMDSGAGFVTKKGRYFGDAVAYLIEAIREAPGQITVCAIGPLTNIASAIREDSRFAGAMKQLVIMGGSFPPGEEQKEYNFDSDPGAVVTVLGSGANIRLGPYQVTKQAVFSQESRAQVLGYGLPLTKLLISMFDQYVKRKNRTWTPLYDPATLGTLYNDSYTTIRRRRLRATSSDAEVRLEYGDSEIEVIEELDSAGFVRHMTRLLATGGNDADGS
jgi:inosine-uridine nucleoside N-ribohydrolase